MINMMSPGDTGNLGNNLLPKFICGYWKKRRLLKLGNRLLPNLGQGGNVTLSIK